MLPSCSKPFSRLVRVVTAPVCSQSKSSCRSCAVVAHGFDELSSGGSMCGKGMMLVVKTSARFSWYGKESAYGAHADEIRSSSEEAA